MNNVKLVTKVVFILDNLGDIAGLRFTSLKGGALWFRPWMAMEGNPLDGKGAYERILVSGTFLSNHVEGV